MSLGEAHSLPPAVQLGGAIVAAVEQDAEQEAEQEAAATAEQRWLPLAEQQLRQLLSSELSVEQLAKLLDNWTTEGRQQQKMTSISAATINASIRFQLAASSTNRRSC